jgi:hypothetical protein
MHSWGSPTPRDLTICAGAATVGSMTAGSLTSTALTAGATITAALATAWLTARRERRKETVEEVKDEVEQRRAARAARIRLVGVILPAVRTADRARFVAAEHGQLNDKAARTGSEALRAAADRAFSELAETDEINIALEGLCSAFETLATSRNEELADALENYDIAHVRVMRAVRPHQDDEQKSRSRHTGHVHRRFGVKSLS